VDWKESDRNLSRQIRDNMWIGTDVKRCSLDLIWSVMWIRYMWKEAVMSKFKVLPGMEQMWKDALMT
jgi:hypothetical protein